MKKIILFTLMLAFSIGATTAFASNSDAVKESNKLAVPNKSENKLSDEEISRLTNRVEEIRDMDKTNMTVKEKRALKKELKDINENVRRSGSVVYIGTGTLILIIILVILLV